MPVARSPAWQDRLAVPAIAAPMTAVSGPELVIAACRMGVIGAFPIHNAPSTKVLALHDMGAQVYADVAGVGHARRALAAGVDGLVLLTAGAGGQTGWANPFAFLRAVREHFAGPLVLAGGITDGRSMLAAEVLGADLVCLGTRFIATHESMADDAYRQALVAFSLDDVRLSSRVGGIPANLLASWLDQAEQTDSQPEMPTAGFDHKRLLSNDTAWSAGHSVSGVSAVTSVADLITRLAGQYAEASADLGSLVINA